MSSQTQSITSAVSFSDEPDYIPLDSAPKKISDEAEPVSKACDLQRRIRIETFDSEWKRAPVKEPIEVSDEEVQELVDVDSSSSSEDNDGIIEEMRDVVPNTGITRLHATRVTRAIFNPEKHQKWQDVDVKVIRAPIEDYDSSVDDGEVKYKCLLIVPPDDNGVEWGIYGSVTKPTRQLQKKPKMEWRGLMIHDRRPRIYQKVPACFGKRATNQGQRGRVLDSYSRVKLIRIAWKVGVENPDGYTKDDCKRFTRSGNYYEKYVDGWKGVQKFRLTQYLWSHLLKTNQVDY